MRLSSRENHWSGILSSFLREEKQPYFLCTCLVMHLSVPFLKQPMPAVDDSVDMYLHIVRAYVIQNNFVVQRFRFRAQCKRWFILQKSCLQSLQRFRLVTRLQSDALSELVSSVTSKVPFSNEFAKRYTKGTRWQINLQLKLSRTHTIPT